jgi:hypothetical protein
MASKKTLPKPPPSQAERFLEMARKAKTSGGKFALDTGRSTLSQRSRKATRIG